MEWFYQLSNTTRIIVLAVGAALLGGVLWVGISSSGSPEDDPTDDPGVIDTTQEPTTEPTEPEEPTESEEPTEEDHLPPVDPETTLSVEQSEAAQEVARDGFVEWLHVDSRETIKERQERLKDYISHTSYMWDTFEGQDIAATMSKDESIYSLAQLGTLDPIGGTKEDFRVLMGVQIQSQMVLYNGTEQSAQIFDTYYLYEVALRYEDGAWKIYDYKETK